MVFKGARSGIERVATEPAFERRYGNLAAVVCARDDLSDDLNAVEQLAPRQIVAKFGDDRLRDVVGVGTDAQQANVQIRIACLSNTGVAPPDVVVGFETTAEVAFVPNEGDVVNTGREFLETLSGCATRGTRQEEACEFVA